MAQAGPKRITAAIRGAPKSMSQQKTQPQGRGGSVPGLDAIEELVHAGLAHGDDQGTLLAQLAEEIPSIDNGLWQVFPDGRMETTWRIKDSAFWHDGAPVTSADLLFAMTVEQDRDFAIPRHPAYGVIDLVQAPDPKQITVTWRRPYIEAAATFSYEVALPLPKHLLEQAYVQDKEGFLGHPYWTHEFVGAGPFRLAEWVIDSHVILKANEHYVLGRPNVDEIEVKFVPDPNTLLANMLAGTELTMGRALPLDPELDAEWKARGNQVAYKTSSWMRIAPQFVNADPPIVMDLRFRRAMLHAIDRQEMVDVLTGGLGSIAHTFVPGGTAALREVEGSVVRYEHDPRRSIQLLDEIGYRRGGDGALRDSAGERLAFEFQTTAQNLVHPKALAVVSGYWEQVGVGVRQNVIPVQRSQDVEYRSTFPAFELALNSTDITSRGVQRYHSASTPLPENYFQNRGNDARYISVELDILIERYVTTIPRAERMQALAQIVQHQSENVTIMGLLYAPMPTLIGARLVNVGAGSGGGAVRSSEAWNAHEWDVRT
jgi:peptide/nickel transport system substrate-binding protein